MTEITCKSYATYSILFSNFPRLFLHSEYCMSKLNPIYVEMLPGYLEKF